jgi:hypothetical protein
VTCYICGADLEDLNEVPLEMAYYSNTIINPRCPVCLARDQIPLEPDEQRHCPTCGTRLEYGIYCRKCKRVRHYNSQ